MMMIMMSATGDHNKTFEHVWQSKGKSHDHDDVVIVVKELYFVSLVRVFIVMFLFIPTLASQKQYICNRHEYKGHNLTRK